MYVGIDPGLNGAIVGIGKTMEVIYVRLMPVKDVVMSSGKVRKHCDITGILEVANVLATHRGCCRIAIEKQWPRPHDGKVQTWNFSGGYHSLLTALESAGLSYHLVTPMQWTKAMRSSYGKEGSIAYVQEHLPGLDLKPTTRHSKNHDGLADAACMALFARLMAKKEGVR